TGRECRTLYALGQQVHGPWAVDFQPGGRLLASINDDGVRLWDLATGKQVETLPVGLGRSAVFGPSGDWLVTSGEQGIQRWPIHFDAQSGNLRIGPPQATRGPPATHHSGVSLSKDGRWLAAVVSNQAAVVIDLEQPANPVSLAGHAGISNVAIS